MAAHLHSLGLICTCDGHGMGGEACRACFAVRERLQVLCGVCSSVTQEYLRRDCGTTISASVLLVISGSWSGSWSGPWHVLGAAGKPPNLAGTS